VTRRIYVNGNEEEEEGQEEEEEEEEGGGGLESARGPDESRRSPVRGFLRFSQEASL